MGRDTTTMDAGASLSLGEPFAGPPPSAPAGTAPVAPTRVRDTRGRLLFEHFPAEGRSVLHVPRGDLEIRADEGGIRLRSRDDVTVESACGSVGIAAADSVTLSAAGEGGTHAELGRDGVQVKGRLAKLLAQEVEVASRSLLVTARRSTQVVDLLETRAGRIVERARSSYREVQELAQTRAGRIRSVARTTWQLLSARAVLRAEKDVKIRGDKIHLA